MSDIVEKLNDLIVQATRERSHYYVKSVCEEAMAELAAAKAQAGKLAEALSFYAEKMNWHYHGYDDEPGIINSCDVDNNGDGGKEARAALAYYRKEMEE